MAIFTATWFAIGRRWDTCVPTFLWSIWFYLQYIEVLVDVVGVIGLEFFDCRFRFRFFLRIIVIPVVVAAITSLMAPHLIFLGFCARGISLISSVTRNVPCGSFQKVPFLQFLVGLTVALLISLAVVGFGGFEVLRTPLPCS